MKKNLFIISVIIIACGAGFFSVYLNNTHLTQTFEQSSENTFFLLTSLVDHYLYESKNSDKGISNIKINEIFDRIVETSDLLYFAVLDEDKKPVIFSTLYEDYLPIRGEGKYVIKTPAGNIFQIERKLFDKYFVAGFALRPLENIRFTNSFLIISIIGIFAVSTLILSVGVMQLEKYKTAKEKEVANLREINALATGFSHEFRNSLHTLSLLARALSGDEAKILNAEIERMKAVMDSLKLLSRAEIKKEKIEVQDLMNEVLSICKGIIPEGVNVNQSVKPNLIITGDSVLLTTALVNLIRNSIEAKAKNIMVSSFKKGNKILIEIIDDGAGVDKNDINRIFEPFYSKKGQTGLGLYLVKKIITAHSGNIEVYSDNGTKFVVSLKEG
ncbi:MAG: HAMP domain-containing sensor histidine kinase [candidate division WOR-3 bacterium]